MPTDEAQLNELPDRFVTYLGGTGRVTPTDRAHPGLGPIGTWTIDPTHSSVIFAWRKLRLWTITGRRPCVGVLHLDELPPVGVIRFVQPSGLPVLTMALDPASVENHDIDLINAMLCDPHGYDVIRHRWWTLRSESLEIMPTGAWRVMATLTAEGRDRCTTSMRSLAGYLPSSPPNHTSSPSVQPADVSSTTKRVS